MNHWIRWMMDTYTFSEVYKRVPDILSQTLDLCTLKQSHKQNIVLQSNVKKLEEF